MMLLRTGKRQLRLSSALRLGMTLFCRREQGGTMRLLDAINPLGVSTMRSGGGSWDSGAYTSSKATRAATGVADFAYTVSASSVHANLDPKRINSKPVGKLESRDSVEHPNSTA